MLSESRICKGDLGLISKYGNGSRHILFKLRSKVAVIHLPPTFVMRLPKSISYQHSKFSYLLVFVKIILLELRRVYASVSYNRKIK